MGSFGISQLVDARSTTYAPTSCELVRITSHMSGTSKQGPSCRYTVRSSISGSQEFSAQGSADYSRCTQFPSTMRGSTTSCYAKLSHDQVTDLTFNSKGTEMAMAGFLAGFGILMFCTVCGPITCVGVLYCRHQLGEHGEGEATDAGEAMPEKLESGEAMPEKSETSGGDVGEPLLEQEAKPETCGDQEQEGQDDVKEDSVEKGERGRNRTRRCCPF